MSPVGWIEQDPTPSQPVDPQGGVADPMIGQPLTVTLPYETWAFVSDALGVVASDPRGLSPELMGAIRADIDTQVLAAAETLDRQRIHAGDH